MEKTDLYSIALRLLEGKWVYAWEIEAFKDYILNNDLREFADRYLRFCLKPLRVSSLISTFPFEDYEMCVLEKVLKKQEEKRKARATAVCDNSREAVRWDNFFFKQDLYKAEAMLRHGECSDWTEIEREVLRKFILFSYEAFYIIRDFEIIGLYLSEQTEPTKASESNLIVLPAELDTPRAREYFGRALEHGFIGKTSTGYEWTLKKGRGSLAQLAYFCSRVYCPNNTGRLPEAALNKLFGVSRIGSSLTQISNAKEPQEWRKTVDRIF